jgi:hypothetical protein
MPGCHWAGTAHCGRSIGCGRRMQVRSDTVTAVKMRCVICHAGCWVLLHASGAKHSASVLTNAYATAAILALKCRWCC